MRIPKLTKLYVLVLFSLFILHETTKAQSVTDGSTPLGLSPGMPAGSYALSDFDAVNLYNGNLGFRLPLLSIGGRGSTGYAMTLRLEQKWVVDKEVTPGEPTMYTPNPNWWTIDGFKPNYSVGRLETRQGGSKEFNLLCTKSHLSFHAPASPPDVRQGSALPENPSIIRLGYAIATAIS